MKRKSIIIITLLVALILNQFAILPVFASSNLHKVKGSIKGIEQEDISNVNVILYSSSNVYQTNVNTSGKYQFTDVLTDSYYLKVELDGYQIFAPVSVKVNNGTINVPTQTVTKVANSNYFHSWKADETGYGYEEEAVVIIKPTITLDNKLIVVNDSSASLKLAKEYNVYLANGEVTWNSEYASRILELFSAVSFGTHKTSVWFITNDHINNYVRVTYGTKYDTVTVSIDAFTNATSRVANVNEDKGIYFSNTLYEVVVRFVTKNGTDVNTADRIFKERFGCSIIVKDYAKLTATVTNETNASFEQFKPEEIISLLTMFEEMPVGFHKVEGLKYLVRRIDGSVNPIYPQAAAVSWTFAGYIEFMDMAFLGDQYYDTFRLILHEKTHFLWAHLFNETIKTEWAKLGQWRFTDNGWVSDGETQFVTAYSHEHNPDEDMAESVAYYILDPNYLKSVAPKKYEFIKNFIMNGEIYITSIREDLTFQVYNLYPDYAFPGRVIEFSVNVIGEPTEDKKVTITLKLDTKGEKRFGASRAFVRIAPIDKNVNQYYDTYLLPINSDNSILTATFNIDKYSYGGYWDLTSLNLYDEVGNTRFPGKENFNWKLYIDNALADITPPKYIDDSIHVSFSTKEVDNHTITYVKIEAEAIDDVSGVVRMYAEIANNTHNSYRMDKWGIYNAETGKCEVIYEFSEYQHSGEYSINHLMFVDAAGNKSGYNFFSDGSGAKSYTTFTYNSELSDYGAPELDENNIKIIAEPIHPENPNGETTVTMTFYIRDDISGFELGSITLLDPQGKTYFDYFYTETYSRTFSNDLPNTWKKYIVVKILPEGVAPGTWGLQNVSLRDKAGNAVTYDFTEIIHFIPMSNKNTTKEKLTKDDYITYTANNYLYTITDTNVNNQDEYIVPLTYNHLNVTGIGENAFYGSTVKKIVIKNQDLVIFDSATTINENTVIYGYADSTAETYAKKYNRTFVSLGRIGDLDGNDKVDDNDFDTLMNYLSEITNKLNTEFADVNKDGKINNKDLVLLYKMVEDLKIAG